MENLSRPITIVNFFFRGNFSVSGKQHDRYTILINTEFKIMKYNGGSTKFILLNHE